MTEKGIGQITILEANAANLLPLYLPSGDGTHWISRYQSELSGVSSSA